MQTVERQLASIDEIAPAGTATATAVAEALEPRDMLSVSPTGGAHGELVRVPTVKVSAVRQAPTSYLGAWTGVCHLNNSTTTKYDFTVNFTHQKGVSVTGTFNFSVAGGAILTTATIGLYPSFMVMVPGPAANVSFVGEMARNGKIVVGRWSALSAKGWLVGTFTMTKN